MTLNEILEAAGLKRPPPKTSGEAESAKRRLESATLAQREAHKESRSVGMDLVGAIDRMKGAAAEGVASAQRTENAIDEMVLHMQREWEDR